MTAGPTPLPPAVSQVMAEPMLYHRAPAFVEVYARVLERLKDVFQTENDVLAFAASRHRRAWSPRWPTSSGPGEPALRAPLRQVRRALGRARARPSAPTSSTTSRAGAAGWTPPSSTALLGENPASSVVFTTLSETSTGVVNDVAGARRGRPPPRRADRRRRGLGHRRGAAAPGRVGRRRRRRRLAEGADVPRPGSASRAPNAARARARRRAPAAAATTSTGAAPRPASARTRPTARSPRPSRCSWRSTSRSG